MAAAAPYLMIAAAGMQAIQSIQQGNAAKAAADHNAAVARRNAVISEQQAGADAEAKDREKIQRLGAIRAAYGASGVGAEGALDLLATNTALFELDKQTILYKGRLRAMGYEDEAGLETASGKAAQRAGRIGAGAALLGGAGKAFSMTGGTPPTEGGT